MAFLIQRWKVRTAATALKVSDADEPVAFISHHSCMMRPLATIHYKYGNTKQIKKEYFASLQKKESANSVLKPEKLLL